MAGGPFSQALIDAAGALPGRLDGFGLLAGGASPSRRLLRRRKFREKSDGGRFEGWTVQDVADLVDRERTDGTRERHVRGSRSRPEASLNVARLCLHPVKSLDGQAVPAAAVLPSGALAHDRAYAIVDAGGAIVNAKEHASIHRLRSHLDIEAQVLTLSADEAGERFHMIRDRARLDDRLGRFFGFAVRLVEDRATGFPDDGDAPGPTLVSTATVEAVAAWFALAPDDVRARLRCNIEIDGVPAFWEDRLLGAGGRAVPFRVGGQRLLGVRACQRCAVPTRDPLTGAADPSFARRFARERRATLPDWAPREQFPHFYRASVNTRIAPGAEAATLRLGDDVALL